MRVAVIGGGRVGGGLAELWRAAGHDVRVSERETVTETAAFGDVILLAVPAAARRDVVARLGSLEGKVLIDATNDLRREYDGAGSEDLVSASPVVKAFNTVFATLYDEIAMSGRPPSMVYCGDDAAAKETTATLIRDAGFEPIDVGGLEQTPDLAAFARLVTGIAYRQGRGPFVYRFEAP